MSSKEPHQEAPGTKASYPVPDLENIADFILNDLGGKTESEYPEKGSGGQQPDNNAPDRGALDITTSDFRAVGEQMLQKATQSLKKEMDFKQDQTDRNTATAAPGGVINEALTHRMEVCAQHIENYPFTQQMTMDAVSGLMGQGNHMELEKLQMAGLANFYNPLHSDQDTNIPAPYTAKPQQAGRLDNPSIPHVPDINATGDIQPLMKNLAYPVPEVDTIVNLSRGFSLNVPVQYGAGRITDDAPGVQANQSFDVHRYRKDFPILQRKIYGHKKLVWLDNGATTQKPQQVIDAINHYYAHYNSNIHRGAHALAAEATDAYEKAREKVKDFIGAEKKEEIIFLRGTTEGINLIANTYGKANLSPGDEIILTELEHHANIVPWQMIARETGAKIVVARIDDQGEVLMGEYQKLFNRNTALVSIGQVSNALGTVLPVKQMISIAHAHNVPVVVDGAQSVQHMPVNVQDLDADFFVFSGHKIFAPMGVGVVYGKASILQDMPPWQGGGAMIRDVTFEKTEFNGIPVKFEAGTPNVEGPIGLGTALDYLSAIGMENIERYEHKLTDYGIKALKAVPGLKIIGGAKNRMSVLSFVINGIDNEMISKELDREGIAIRVGHHCAQPAVRRMGYESIARASTAFYNTTDEIDHLVEVLHKLVRSKF